MKFASWMGRGKRKLVRGARRAKASARLFLDDTSDTSLPLNRRIGAAWRGYSAYTAKLYQLDRHNAGDYVSDLQRKALRRITPRYNIIFDDKVASTLIFDRVVRTPEILAYLDRGIVDSSGNPLAVESVIERIKAEGQVVLKPLNGSGGKGFTILSTRRNEFYANDQIVPDLEAFLSRCERSFLSTFLVQHPYASALYPHSVNTLRIVTMRHPDTREIFVSHAVQRIGNDRSAPVDNFSRGGISVAVDKATGELVHAVSSDKGTGNFEVLERHPDTGAMIVGMRVPNWGGVLDAAIRGHSSFPQVEMIGWDFALNEQAEPVMIEVNVSSDVDLIQVHGPMLTELPVRRFFEFHGIV